MFSNAAVNRDINIWKNNIQKYLDNKLISPFLEKSHTHSNITLTLYKSLFHFCCLVISKIGLSFQNLKNYFLWYHLEIEWRNFQNRPSFAKWYHRVPMKRLFCSGGGDSHVIEEFSMSHLVHPCDIETTE